MTQDDSLYVIRFFEVFFDEYPKDEIEIMGVTIERAFGESLGKTARRIYRGICRPSGNCSTAKKHAVITVHEMAEELDAGAVLGTLECPLRERDNLDRVITETKHGVRG